MGEHLSASSKVAAEVSIFQLALGGCERWWRGTSRTRILQVCLFIHLWHIERRLEQDDE